MATSTNENNQGDCDDSAYEDDHERERRRERRREKDRGEKRRDRSRSKERRSSRRDEDRDYDRDKDRGGDRDRRHRDRGDRGDRDDRRGRDGGDRDRRRSRSRERRSRRSSRSASPRSSSRRHSSVTPIHLRPRKLNNWDVPPAAYPGMSAAEVKQTGHFPLPGQPGRMATGFGAFDMFGMKMSQGAAGPVAQSASLARQARRLYVGNIPYGIQEDGLMEFFNGTMAQLNITTAAGNPCIAVQINHDKNYAFIEFRSSEEATAAMAFDGITFNGQSLKIRRPKDYQAPVGGASGTPPPIHVPGVVSTNVPDSPNKIFVGGLPPFLNDEQVMELLKSFGELRAFNLVKDGLTGMSKGFAFCEYVDPTITDIACQGLNGMELGDKKLVVQRASVGANKMGVSGFPMMSMMPTQLLSATGSVEPTTVILLLNMVTVDELIDDQEYEDLMEDVREECMKFGTVRNLTIPRPTEGREGPGVGKIFVQYETLEQSGAALRSLAGRKFAERTVVAAYYDENMYSAGQF
ncbi:hypothetical protein PhCBS80983_g00758 [Powellomyces hirtus]|uniref:Splicing factor U2AF subunit n=1 Tax=Powellomyces hirtus TaxID=109895 RepID=A0A507ECK5_9FUNG|nr:hypothetical protein PhCBS80983_g00758 [Powellomyces hirtus]